MSGVIIPLTPAQQKHTASLAYRIGRCLRRERTRRKYSLRYVHVQAGVDTTNLMRIEDGVNANVGLATLVKLLGFYGLTLAIVPAASPTPSEER